MASDKCGPATIGCMSKRCAASPSRNSKAADSTIAGPNGNASPATRT
jgi:hypothetical protein